MTPGIQPQQEPRVQPAVLPFLSRSQPEAVARWLAALGAALPDHRVVPFAQLSPAERAVAEVAIVADPDPAELAQLPALKWVQGLWAGVERMMAELPAGGPQVVRLVDPMLARTMATAVLAWTLYLYRDMPRYRQQQQDRVWRQHVLPRPAEVPVGILGLGTLGRQAAAALIEQGFPVIGWSQSPKTLEGGRALHGAEGLHELLAQARIVIVLLPLTPDTRGLLADDLLARMQSGAALVNFGRGPILDTSALLAALDRGHLSHAVLDVFDQEPLPATSPLWSHPGVTVLPHISAPTDMQSASQIAADNITAFLATGAIPPGVDRARGY